MGGVMITEWITADNHAGHRNILGYCKRPFANVDEMDDAMVERWNSVVGKEDRVWHLADFCLGPYEQAAGYFARLNGNIHVLATPWHHDWRWLDKAMRPQFLGHMYTASGAVSLEGPVVTMLHNGYYVVMHHYPYAHWDREHHGSVHLHGHSHGNYQGEGRILDVGVDCHDFYPISLDKAIELAIAKESHE